MIKMMMHRADDPGIMTKDDDEDDDAKRVDAKRIRAAKEFKTLIHWAFSTLHIDVKMMLMKKTVKDDNDDDDAKDEENDEEGRADFSLQNSSRVLGGI